MQTLDVLKKEKGKLFYRQPSPSSIDGICLKITHSVSSALPLNSRNVRFLQLSFSKYENKFIASDHQGNIFHFDIDKNHFSLIQRTGSPCTTVNFELHRKCEFLVGMLDFTLKCFSTESRELVAWMKGHNAPINSIFVHASGRYAVTSSQNMAILWDLDTFQRKRKLNIKQDVAIVKVFFLPMSNTIITCFKDDTIFAWEAETMECKFQLHVPDSSLKPQFKAFAATRDGRVLVAGGRSKFLHVWALDTKKLQKIVELPNKVTCVKDIQFLPDQFDGGANQILGVLCQDGIMRFININSCKMSFDIGSIEDRIHTASINYNGNHVAATMESGDINLYDIRAVTAEINKPPPPIVKVVKHKNTSSSKPSKITQTNSSYNQLLNKFSGEAEQSKSSVISALPEGINLEKLYSILRGYGEYPEKYRTFIWRSILRLPENHAAYGALVDKGIHPSFKEMDKKYPLKSHKLLRVLQRVLSALAHWSPIFSETEYLPLLAFPFVKLFQNNQLICFEIIATVLVNWSEHWFEYFPNPPVNVLSMVENLLAHHDKDLLRHLIKHGVTSQVYAWPLLSTLFSQVLTGDEWLTMFDNIFSNKPAFLLMCVVAYCSICRGPLMKCTEFDDFKFFFNHCNAVDVSKVIKEAYRFMESTPADIDPSTHLSDLQPLTVGQYPVFNKYPKFIVDYQVQERERIRQEELAYLQQRKAGLELEKETQRRQGEEEAWFRQQKLLLDAEQKRRHLIQEEEEKLAEQRVRVAAMNRELKLKELQLMDATRRKFLNYQQNQKEIELTRLEDELKQKRVLREKETQQAVEAADIRNMELKIQSQMFEQELYRNHMDNTMKFKSEAENRRRQQELNDNRMRNLSNNNESTQPNNVQENLAHVETLKNNLEMRRDVDKIYSRDNRKRIESELMLKTANDANKKVENEMNRLIKNVKDVKQTSAYELYENQCKTDNTATEEEEQRIRRLEQQVAMARQQVDSLENTQDEMLERLRRMRETSDLNINSDLSAIPNDSNASHNSQLVQGRYINESLSSELSSQLSLDRNRNLFDRGQTAMLNEVQKLRSRIALSGRNDKPPVQVP